MQGGPFGHGLDRNELLLKMACGSNDLARLAIVVANYTLQMAPNLLVWTIPMSMQWVAIVLWGCLMQVIAYNSWWQEGETSFNLQINTTTHQQLGGYTKIKGVVVCQVISLYFEWIH